MFESNIIYHSREEFLSGPSGFIDKWKGIDLPMCSLHFDGVADILLGYTRLRY